MEPTNYYVIPLPLSHCVCPPRAGEPNVCIVTGSWCSLLSCIDLGNRFHHSHTHLYNLAQVHASSVNSPQSSSAILATITPTFNPTMVCHCMWSRRGGTRGGSSHSPAMSSPNLVSPTSSADNTNLHGTRRGDEAVCITNFPLPLHPTPYTTQFWFCSSLNHPIIIATVTITFTKRNWTTNSSGWTLWWVE